MDAQKLHEQNTKMNQEVKHFARVSSNLKLIKKDLRMRLDGLLKESNDIREKILSQEGYMKQFKDDIFQCLHYIGDYKKLKRNVIQLHKVYVKEEHSKNEKDDKSIVEDFSARRKHLEKNLEHLRLNLSKDKKTQKAENSRIMIQNVNLLQEINDLTRQLHLLELNMKTETHREADLARLKRGGGNADEGRQVNAEEVQSAR